MNKVFITGATGFIGSLLALRLAESGKVVHALCRSTSDTSCLKHENIKIFTGDITDKASIEDAMRGCDVVYHLAAYAKLWARTIDTYYNTNIQGTENVLYIANKLKIYKTVVTSTAGVYGVSEEEIITEKSEKYIDYYTGYEITKLLAENVVNIYLKRHGMNIVVLSPSRVFGPGLLNQSNAVTKIIKQYIKGRWHFIPGNGETIGNYVFIDDVVNGHILAMKKGKPGRKYILGGVNVSYNDFFDTLKKVSQKQYRLYRIPLSLMLTFAWIQKLLAVFGVHPLITPQWVKKYNHDAALSSKKAERELGYKITLLSDGIQKTITWLQKGDEARR